MYYPTLKVKLPQILFLTVIILVSASAAFLPSAHSASRPRINSQWTSNPPTIDGNFVTGEWFNLQIIMRQTEYPIDANAYFLNDASNLYVLVDAIGDTTNNPADECYMRFNFNSQVDVYVHGNGAKGTGYTAAAGYHTSPNSGTNHMIYEFCIPFIFLKTTAGQDLDICSPLIGKNSIVFDAQTLHDNVWPLNLDVIQQDTWGLLVTQSRPATVGGVLMPVNKLGILMPYLALAGLVAAISSVVVVRRRSKA